MGLFFSIRSGLQTNLKISKSKPYIKKYNNGNQGCLRIEKRQSNGVVHFNQEGDGPVSVSGSISGLAPGLHGFHVHQFGDNTDGCTSTEPNYNPDGAVLCAPTDCKGE